jgi:hypothetical protein
MRKFVAPYKK